MSSYTTDLIDRYRPRGILVDTTLLLLYVVGSYDPAILQRGSFDRLAAYSFEDFEILCNLTSLFTQRVTTPYVLAEVSNWIGYLKGKQEVECLRGFVTTLEPYRELKTDSFELGREAVFP